MDPQDLYSADEIGIPYGNLAIETARTQKCRVKHFRTVSGRHDDYWRIGVSLEPINFGQQLIEGLLPLVVASKAYDSSPALTDGINLVNENDRGSCLARLLE